MNNEVVNEKTQNVYKWDEFRRKTKKFLHKIKFDKWKAWIYLLPAIVLLAIFTVWPIINTVRMAFLDGYRKLEEVGGATFQFGIQNFKDVVTYKDFGVCLKNTMLLCVLTVPISTPRLVSTITLSPTESVASPGEK